MINFLRHLKFQARQICYGTNGPLKLRSNIKIDQQEQSDIPETNEIAQEPEKEYIKPSVQVPFMITRLMKQDLADLGYSLKDISHLTPMDAQEIIQMSKKKAL